MSSYSSRNNRYYDSARQSHGNNSRSQPGNPVDEETMEGMSEDLQKIFDDDSKCARLLKKVIRDERSFDLRIQRIQEFQVYLERSDSNKFIMKLAEPALNVLFEQFQERSHETIRSELAHCMGLIGYAMLNEGEPKFSEWIFERLNDVRKNDSQRQLLINAFRHSIQNEREMLCLANEIEQISDQLKKILESVVHAPLMIAITDTIIELSRIYPQIFQEIFVDIVDILIGWYIEPLPTDRILEYTAQALQKFRPFWVDQIERTTLTLLDHFIEDADNYAQQFELQEQNNDGDGEIASFTDKIAALYRAFATVLRALSDNFAATPHLLPVEYVDNWLQKILHTTTIIRHDKLFGILAKPANTAVCILLETFSQFDEQLKNEIFDFIIEQTHLHTQSWPYEADVNLLRLIMKVIDIADHDSCAKLASSIFAAQSRLWLYRFLYSNALIQDVLQLFNRLLTIKSIPVVQQVYQAILADMTSNFNVLLNVLEQKLIVIGSASATTSDLNEDDAEAALIFDCSALCQIGNVKGNLIGMYALSPPLFELLAKHLQLTNSKLARQYPAVHYGVLKTLYSHCAAHEHFIHNSDLFKQNDTTNVMSLTSLTKDNFEDLLKLQHRLIVNSHLSCHDTKKLVLNWLAEIIDALPQEDNGLLTLPLLLKLSHAIIDIAYSDEEEICNLCCRLLNKIVKRQRDLDVSFLVRLFDLCRFWLQSNETSIHDSYYAILCCLPVNILTSKFPTHGTLLSSKNDYSGFASIVKRNHMNTPYLGTFTTHCFNLILGYILVNHQMPRMYATTWLERLFQSCQRKSNSGASKDEHLPENQHRLLSYEQLPNFGNDALIWFWAIWECAQFCVMNKLKTPLGKPQETFLALEETLRFFAWPIDNNTKKAEGSSSDQTNHSSTPSSTVNPPATASSSSGEVNVPTDKGDWWCDLHRCGLLLQLIEALEKCMYNAYEGAALSLPQLPKTVKFFFITNKTTCCEWLNRIRIPMILTAVRSGQYESAARNCNQYLMHACSLGQVEAVEFEFVIISFVQSLIKLHNSMAIHGIYVWLKNTHQIDWSWIQACEHEAAGNLEQAAYEYKLLLNEHFKNLSATNEKKEEKISGGLAKFLTQKVYDCYLSLHQWPELIAWNEACLKMQLAFLQDDNEDLRSSMETTIDINAIRAMSCFENRDFEGLKVAMRKMPNAQATGEELGLSISCGWDMETFDMLATVETLKGVSKRRSGLWSLNAVLQLTQDLTRIHNVDEHASWSEERAAISQVAALYQSENREVPLLPGQKFAPVQHSVRALNSILLYSQPNFNNQSASTVINSNWTALRMGAARLARQQNNFTLASKLLIQQFQTTHNWPTGQPTPQASNTSLGSPLRSFHAEASSIETYSLASLLTMIERYQNAHMVSIELETETGKLMHALSLNKANNINITIPIEFLSRSILRHLINESQINPGYNNQRSIINIEKCSRNLLHIAKWSRTAIESNHETTTTNVISLGKLFQLRKQYLHTGLGVDIAGEPFVRKNIPLDELLIGELLDFSTLTCPALAKSWFRFADWAYMWGRQLLARSIPLSALDIGQQVRSILPSEVSSDEVIEISRILSSIRILNDDDSELTASELSSLHSYRTDLSRACSLLTKHPMLIEQLLALHPQYDLRRYFLLEQSCRAYFTYLQLSNTSAYANSNEKKSNNNNNGDDASNILVTLRLLRVLVRYPQQLRTIFDSNLFSVPTVAWKRLIPQLFSRLNHPDSFVRDYVTNLLIRIAKDFPQLILYSVVVGITDDSKMRRIKSRDEQVYKSKSSSTHESEDEKSQDDIEEEEDDDEEEDEEEMEEEEEYIEKQENVVAMQNSLRLIYNVLSETNAHVVGQVKLFVHELRRVTVLWDELWLGTMAQLQEEISRRVDVLKDELQRLESMTHLTKEEKEFMIKEKQDILFKSFITVLEAVSQITRAPAETPREQTFQKDYSKQIDAAIEQLKQPITLSNPHACWLQLRQLYSMLHRTGKRSGTIHAMNQISPKLAEIKHSVIPIPGEDGQFHTIYSVGQTVQVLPTKTRPKKLMFVGSNGRRYQYLLKGLEDLHLDERIMQLLSIINVMFTKINRNEPWSYEARNYTVIPLASRSGLIQWVEGATPLFTLYKRWQQRQGTALTWKAQNDNQEITIATVQKPNDVYYSKLNAILKEKGKQPVEDRREVPMPILRQCIEELIRETPADLLARELWCSCPSVGLWYKNVQNYSRSLAVTSMIGYMIGLGDRHLDNVLVDLKSGQIIHIDYNICFEKGKKLRVPEKVPYRLTQNLQNALGIAGSEGVFSLSSENVLKILRNGKEILLNLLESFIYDPLIDWTGHDTGVLAAFYGGQSNLYEQITIKKRQVEKDALLRMFHLRQIEIRHTWINLGESINRTMNKLIQRVNDINELEKNISEHDIKMSIMERRLDYFKTALESSSTNHSLFSLLDRRKQLQTIRTDMNTAKDLVLTLYQNLEDILANSTEAHADLKSKAFCNKLHDFIENDHVSISTSPVVLAADFLHTAGKTTLLHQSEQLDDELRHTLKVYRAARQPTVVNIFKSLVDLCHYLPKDYIESSLLTKLKDRLSELCNNFTTEKCQEFLNDIDTYFLIDETSPSRSESISRALSIDNQFNEYIQIVNQEISKISELQTFIHQSPTDVTIYKDLFDTTLQNLDNNEHANYRNTLLLMLLDRWQHCRQMGDTARNLFNVSSLTDISNDTFTNEIYTLISNTAYLGSIIQQNSTTMSSDSPLIDSTVKLITSLENVFRLLKDLLNNFELTTIPSLIRAACSKQNSLFVCMDQLNNAFQQIQHMAASNSTASVDDTCQIVYQQLRSSWTDLTDEIFDAFLNLSNSFDHLDKELNNVCTLFQMLNVPAPWLQSPLFDWKQTNIDNDEHRKLLTNFFAMTKIATMRQVCQLIIDHSQTFNNLKSQITKDNDLSMIMKKFILLYIVQYLADLPALATSYLIFSLIPSSQSMLETNIIETDNQFQDFINNICLITPTTQLADLQQLLAQINGIWQNCSNAEHVKTSLDILQIRKHSNEMQLMAYRWKNFHLLKSNNKTQQRQKLIEELTTDQNILTINDSISTVIIEKMANLEQTVIQRLRWAAGANPLVQDVLDKFEIRQKERANEIDNDKQLCLHLVQMLQSWLLFEQYEEQIKLQRDLIIHARTFAEKGLEICLLKNDIESNFSIVEQAVLEFPPVENLKQITLQNLPSLIEQAENECMKHKRNRIKEERELENRRDETSHLITELKEHMSQHNINFKDISSVLKSLLKVIPHRALQNYSNIHREFLELCHTVVKHTLHIDRSSSMQYAVVIVKMKRISTIKTKVFDDLIQLNPTIDNENRERINSSTANTCTQHEATDKTTKVTEERNKYAVEICKRIRDKLDGSDPDPLTQSSISEQVRYTIREATDIENLATLYEGWTSWV
ncbi:unnamed protein product [Rotaria socialis]|uniref:non-specific serine/threonine protein kinase n=1 Tax=Rotaria socialis TaxID=392032 RepID=A0A819VUG8_9BILA|nr:unnamed protein product [Rotaria socialis]CAF4113858.1 unnamed protein product [Rotaria socialis]